MMRGGVVWDGQGPRSMVWCVMDQRGVVRSVLVLFGAEGTGIVDVLLIGRDITAIYL
jgi:hypothetical protein